MHPRRLWMLRLASGGAGWCLGQAQGAGAGAGASSAAGAVSGPAANAAAAVAPAPAPSVQRGRVLAFPADHGAHLAARTEWWYATGWLSAPGAAADMAAPTHGFQVTFFRSRTGLAQGNTSRFAARQLLFAHAALTSLASGQHQHDQRIARWSGAPGAVLGSAATADGDVRLGGWALQHTGAAWQARVPARDFALQLTLSRTQPLLLQGDAGFSRKGPDAAQASHYVTEPQLAAVAKLGATKTEYPGRAWMDHEWSDEILHPSAVGWDWIGMNLADGSALTVFVLRRADGSTLWAGGSHRSAGGAARSFAPAEVRMVAGRRWRSASTGASYPVQWQVHTPAGSHRVRALLDTQELDSRQSTGTVYWEGLSELLDDQGVRVGLGYLEMTGYAAPLRM